MTLRASSVLAAACAALMTAGCRGEPAAHGTPAAKVANSKPESELATITLSPEAETRLAIQTTTIGATSVAVTRTVGGEAMAPPGRSAIVAAPAAGTLGAPGSNVFLRRVKKGQAIFELLPLSGPERDARGEAERVATEARARLTEAEQRLERQKHLLADGAVSARAVEEATAARDIAKAADGAARDRLAALERLRIGPRGEMAITAPFDGVVTAMRAAAGQSVNAGAPLFEVAQISTLWVRVALYSGELANVRTDEPASVAATDGARPQAWITARPVQGPLSADASASSADLFYELTNDGELLRPGERVMVRLPLRGSDQSLVVPQSAIVYDLVGGTWVYEAKAPHVFARRRVEIDGPSAAGVIVRRGLAEGVRVVTVGAAELYGTEFFVGK